MQRVVQPLEEEETHKLDTSVPGATAVRAGGEETTQCTIRVESQQESVG